MAAEPEPEPAAEVDSEPEPEPEPEPAPEADERDISPGRLDAALQRLRREIPAREDGGPS